MMAERGEYIEAFNRTMVNIWRDRILQLGVFEQPRRASRSGEPHLIDTLRCMPVNHDGAYMSFTLQYSFVRYGVYVDAGTGREKSRGNSGDIGSTTKAGNPRKIRQSRPWFGKAWYRSVENLKDHMQRMIGDEFVGIMRNEEL